jgi:UDP:flavonoid glycosyltransferase YjiC (YdhE family)
LGGELADILPKIKSIPRILVHRDINPNYVHAKDLQRFVADYFDLVLIPGETGELAFSQLPQVHHTAPWLMRSADELPTRSAARTLLHLNPLKAVSSPASRTPLVLIYTAGRAEELAFYGQLTQELANSRSDITVRCLSAQCPEHCPPELWVFHWPGIECLPAADVVIGGAGYNTFYECVAVGVPLVAFAFERHYDRQKIRVKRWCEHHPLPPVRLVKSMEDAKLAVNEFLQLGSNPPPNLMNGAIAGVQCIEELSQRI